MKDRLMSTKNKTVQIDSTKYEMLGVINDGDSKVRLKDSAGKVEEMTSDSFITLLNEGKAKYLD
ncbi:MULTISPECIES: hypothetical protein [Acetobacter]|nr:hypothetical protein [Acetobacter pasteurianus]ARW46961.1 hypothetical protein S1001342_00603 [Acetobacter pasteurianus subsp. pasteurianus]CCT60138.1 hypothetical protein APA386B_2087 [Acetobacter pasteurianus 386B]BAH98748.1 hypothetical protein APA01_05980 [Acetobacter pasteurianus IFO 3283-01]BAI01799.1 hypothetical protein APA03_05980 [Acetobacter pasteurianus IFO 3283-03]BAI04847.1 hypothetical protein APA07_05980 [Acetobacter pasteurianus IFO 3283-07]BAI07894.1 hypothetical protein 